MRTGLNLRVNAATNVKQNGKFTDGQNKTKQRKPKLDKATSGLNLSKKREIKTA
nr:hypothetical protein [uncultured Campylobacter sp.]